MANPTKPSLSGPSDPIPARAGVGLKARHYGTILESRPDVGWFEVHAENYMGAGGPPHAWLEAIRAQYPLSVHGVGLSIGADRPLDDEHLKRLSQVVNRYQPALVSEHLAWSTHDTGYVNDLLPMPYCEDALARVVEHIDHVQRRLGRKILIENPSTYVRYLDDDMSEIEFLEEMVRRSGCGLLLDVNNVFVSATNHGFDATRYLEAFPMAAVAELHLGGHAPEIDDLGEPLLIDAHDREVADAVWSLYGAVIARLGPMPTLIEWDNGVPAWPVLFGQARRAEAAMSAAVWWPREAANDIAR